MSLTNEAELTRSIAEKGEFGFCEYESKDKKEKRLQLKVHFNSVFLDEKEAMGVLLNAVVNGRKVFGKHFGLDLVEYILYIRPGREK